MICMTICRYCLFIDDDICTRRSPGRGPHPHPISISLSPAGLISVRVGGVPGGWGGGPVASNEKGLINDANNEMTYIYKLNQECKSTLKG